MREGEGVGGEERREEWEPKSVVIGSASWQKRRSQQPEESAVAVGKTAARDGAGFWGKWSDVNGTLLIVTPQTNRRISWEAGGGGRNLGTGETVPDPQGREARGERVRTVTKN